MFQRSLAAALRVSTQLRRRPMSNALRMRPADRAAQLAEKYGLEIATFSHPVLSVVDTVLSHLPKAHIRGGFVHAIARGGATSACYYDHQSCTIHIGSNLLTSNWYHGRVAHPDSMPDSHISINRETDLEMGLDFDQRDVFGGISDAISRGNVLESSLLHEIGHAVVI